MRKTTLHKKGRRAKREAEALQAFRLEVRQRAGGHCQYPGCQSGRAADLHPHHMKTNPRVHDPDFGRLLCWEHHRAIHDHNVDDWKDWFA